MKVQMQIAVALIAVLLLIEQCMYFELHFVICTNDFYNKKINSIRIGNAIWCYRCTSATPGCAENFHWRGIGYWGEQCPEDNDICVKVIERKGGNLQLG